VRAVLEKYIEVMFKKPDEDGFQSLRNYQKWKIWKIWPKNSRKVQNGLDQKGDVLEKNFL
jgi:hypothetical protein